VLAGVAVAVIAFLALAQVLGDVLGRVKSEFAAQPNAQHPAAAPQPEPH